MRTFTAPGGLERLWRAPLFSLGAILVTICVLMFVTALVALLAQETPRGALAGAVLSGFVGAALLITFRLGKDQPRQRMSLRSAFLFTALGWLVMPLFAAVPFMIGDQALGFTDAVFETVSGLTTTGGTVVVGLDDYPKALLLWRALLQLFGGAGVILIAVLLLPSLRVGGAQLFQLESSDRSGDRFVPRSANLILWILSIYGVLNLIAAIAFAAAGMPAFDAICHAMSAIATGGFSTRDANLGGFDSAAVRWVATISMLAGALPFMAYIKSVRGRIMGLAGDVQIQAFVAFCAVVIVLAHLYRWAELGDDVDGTLSHTAVNIVSVITTTGFTTQEYQAWGPAFVGLFFVLSFAGGCAGSTTGGIKIYRFQVLFLMARAYMRRLYDPNVVQPRRYGGRAVDEELILAILAFVAVYVAAVSLGAFALALCGLDFTTAFSGAAASLGNVGPGLGDVIGPVGNFSTLNDPAKWIIVALMLLGRLELFAILVLLDPRFWRH